MYKATRELIKARQVHTNLVVEVVTVKNISGGKKNDCFNNSCAYLEKTQSKIVSGWLVNKYDPSSNSTEIIQHFWNINHEGIFVDTTPIISDDYEYVIDMELLIYGQENLDEINNCICSSLLFKDGKYKAVDFIDKKWS